MFERMYSTRKLNSSLGLALALFCLCAVSCANMFQDKVAMSRNGTSSSLRDLLVRGEKGDALESPSDIQVSLYEFKDKIRITWSPVKHAEYYILERAVATEKDENGEWKEPEETEYEPLEHSRLLTRNIYIDTIISGDLDNLLNCDNKNYGYAFFYRVFAAAPQLGYTESEPTVSSAGILLPPPLGTYASTGDFEEYIEINWNRSSGANRYKIYRSEKDDGSTSHEVATVSSNVTSYKDVTATAYPGQDLHYTVTAVGYNGEESVSSPIALGYTKVEGAPERATGVMIKEGAGHGDNTNSITVTWKPDESSDDIIYTIYRTSSENSTMKKLGTGSSEYVDKSKDLKENVYYYYYVQSSKEKIEGEVKTVLKGPMSESGPNSDSPAEGFILSAPSSVEVVKNKDSTKRIINFAPVIGDEKFATAPAKASYSNTYQYVVYGDKEPNGYFTEKLNSATSHLFKFENGKYSMEVEPRNYYKIKVEYNGESTELKGPFAPAPYEARNVYVTRAELVGDYDSLYKPVDSTKELGANANGVHQVKITWERPEDEEEGKVLYYEVYRSEKIGSGFRKITEKPLSEEESNYYEGKYWYIDENESARIGRIYYYKVLSLNSLEQGANYSEIDAPELDGNKIIKTKNDDGTPYGRGWGWGAISAWHYIVEMCKTVMNSHEKSNALRTGSSLSDKQKDDYVSGRISGYMDYSFSLGNMYATVYYKDYADYSINNDDSLGIYFSLTGNTDTKADISQNGQMNGTVVCMGMYPGSVNYNNIKVVDGDSGGGYYVLRRDGIETDEKSALNVDYLAGK